MEGTIGEIRMFAGNFAPKSWAFCQGQIQNIASNTALFSILGTTYGGNGTTTFALPDLQGRFPIGVSSEFQLGEKAGTESVTLTSQNLASHTHAATLSANAANATQPSYTAGVPASIAARVTTGGYTIQTAAYGPAGGGPMAADVVVVNPAGSNFPLDIMNAYLGMNYVICQYGVYPQRS